MKNSSKNQMMYSIKEFSCETIKRNKIKLMLVLLVTIIALLTGVIIAIKTKSISTFSKFLGQKSEHLNSTNFWLRLLSMLIVFSFIFIGCLTKWLCPLAYLFLAYRAFLMGGNIMLLLLLNGISGIVIGVLVVLPCQLLTLIVYISFYLLFCDGKNYACHYGCDRARGYKAIVIVSALVALLLICLLESLLILVIPPKIIFVF